MSYKKSPLEKSETPRFSDAIRTIGIADIFIVIAMIAAMFAVFPLLKSGLPDSVVVFRNNSLAAEYPLDEDAKIFVNGKNGAVGIEIVNREVKITHVNCPHQICRRTGSISQTFGQLVCAPNNILVEIRSAKSINKRSVDGITH